MQVHHKPKVDTDIIQIFLKRNWHEPVTKLDNLVEGEDSQAFYFDTDNHRYVIRINKSDYGFKKDAYASTHFTQAGIPIPKIYQIGMLDSDHAYCISDFVVGKTIQDLDRTAVEAILPDTLGVLQIIRDVDINSTTGYGEIDLSGNGKSVSWQEWLLAHISPSDFNWHEVVLKGCIKQEFLDRVFSAFRQLTNRVPNERCLIHGDFSSNNVLVGNNKIVAVLDWDSASYGDWLFDIAGAYYWRDHLPCMDVQADYYEKQLSNLPNYHARIICYQIRAALIEMYVQAMRGENQKLEWHVKRCRTLVQHANNILEVE